MNHLSKIIAFFLFLITSCKVTYAEDKKYELVVCAVFQNENFFLKEWLEFHKLMGVQHFYLYNNSSTDSYEEILKPYIQTGEVELFEWPSEVNNQNDYLNFLQIPVYTHALSLAKETSRWIAFIDLDEFLFPVYHRTLPDLLKNYESYAGLAVNWQIYGTSWIDTLPKDGLIIENLILKAPQNLPMNQFVKLIVQPQHVKTVNNPHSFTFNEGFFAVDSNNKPYPNNKLGQAVVIDKVRINHYWSGTYDWLIKEKIPRREKWGFVFSQDYLKAIQDFYNQVVDKSIFRFIPELKKRCYINNQQSKIVGEQLLPYKDLLENGTYEGADWSSFQTLPKSRYETFKEAFTHFENSQGAVVVELGTSRSFTHGGHPGCNLDDSKYWTPNQPENWDWGAGFFTYMAATCLNHLNPKIHTIDIISNHIERCKVMTEPFKDILTYHTCSSVDFLKNCQFPNGIDLLYLDTGDMTPIEPTALLQLEEAQVIVERDLISPDGQILIDDVKNQTPKKFGDFSDLGKSKYALPFLLQNGFEIVMDEYQILLRRKGVK